MKKIFLISDTHFGHLNIIKYCRTAAFPFSAEGLAKMNEVLKTNWNNTISPEDTVIHLGDVMFKIPPDEAAAIINSLNGTKVLIRGNHDKSVGAMLDMGFSAVFEEVVLRFDGYNILCTHRPKMILPENTQGVFHGHTHNASYEDLKAAGENPDIPVFNVNLSVEVIHYRPLPIADAFGKLKHQTKQTAYAVR